MEFKPLYREERHVIVYVLACGSNSLAKVLPSTKRKIVASVEKLPFGVKGEEEKKGAKVDAEGGEEDKVVKGKTSSET